MKDIKTIQKEYKTPQFELVRQDESAKVFFTASGATQSAGELGSMTSTAGQW